MLPRIAHIRRLICQDCPNLCQVYLDGKIDHTDPAVACPVSWSGQWHVYRGHGEVVPASSPSLPPSFWAKAIRLSRSFLVWQEAGYPKRSKADIKSCLDLCRACPAWREEGNLGLGECTHPKCGCTRFKPQWATEHCPIDKW